LYHLLTNQAPIDARERFLHPESQVSLRQVNPEVSAKTDRAVQWAMSLHPDERPESIDRFRMSLIGDSPSSQRTNTRPPRLRDYFRNSPERTLLAVSVSLVVLSFFITMIH
jgi:serine/threonine-protein kinase